jgi:outer membrane receptor protein involved in Fe transport
MALTGAVSVAQEGEIEEILVTSQKREQRLQDVPLSVQVLGEARLEDLGIRGFDDYVRHLPSVSHQSAGPGQSQIYMRGVSDGGDGNFSGTSPSVAVYLDEQPVTSIGRNLDVHVYDVARIEALAGPQGTLFGANSQAGVLRIVTNRPDSEAFDAGFDLGLNTTKGGDPGYSGEGFVNVPMGDRAALRVVGWYLEDGGWIDVVPGSQTFTFSGLTVDNEGNSDEDKNTVEDDYNTLTNAGLRAALGIDLTESWTVTGTAMYQNQQSDGVFAHQPDDEDIGNGNVLRFYQDDYEDEWAQLGLLLEGSMEFADFVFSGTYLDRDVQYDIDYTQYAEYSPYVEYYYTCAYDDSYVIQYCNDPRIQYDQDSTYKRSTFEARLQSPGDGRLNWVAGIFYTEDKHDYFNKWLIPTIVDGSAPGQSPKDIPQDRNIDGVENLYFATNQRRKTSETAFYGEISYDFTEKFNGTFGLRVFETKDELAGFVGSRFSCFDEEGNRIGNGDPSVDGDCGGGLKVKDDDVTIKVNASYAFTDDVMGYATYSEGFRPGGINREDSPVIPQIYSPDFLKNYEIGMKTSLADGAIRLNSALYFMDWKDLQLTRFDKENFGSFLGLTANTTGADVWGFETDMTLSVSDALTVGFAFSLNNSELKEDFFVAPTDPDPAAPKGTRLPFAPDFKYTLDARYGFDIANRPSYAQAVLTYTSKSYNDLFVEDRESQDSYSILDLTAGTDFNNVGVELYLANVFNERAEILRYSRAGDDRITTNRPRSFGIRLRYRM